MKWSKFYTITGCVASVLSSLLALCMPNPYAVMLYGVEAGAMVVSMIMMSHVDIDSVEAW